MDLFEATRVALAALRANKLRSLLTMLGIIIGVGSVIGMLAIGNGFRQFLDGQFDKLGSGAFYIYPGAFSRNLDAQVSPELNAADAAAILQSGAAPAVETVATVLSSNLSGITVTISTGDRRFTYDVSGVNPEYFQISENKLGAGRFYTAAEDAAAARVTLIGKKVAERIFGGVDAAIGQRILINGVSFEVVGVLITDASFGPNPNPSEWIFVPYKTARNRLFRNSVSSRVDVSQLTVKTREGFTIDEAIRQTTDVIRQQHRLTYQNNNFTIINPDQIAASFNAVIGGFNAFLGIVAGISLLVGGIGIMNIMLVSVTERTREIGLRKAVGAKRRDVLLQFLTEALMLCLIGSLLGVILGYGLSGLGTFVLVSIFQAQGATAAVSLNSVMLATGIAAAIGVFFGLFPALQAAQLKPIEALRYE